MRLRALLPLCLPLGLVGGCLLPSFENVPGSVDQVGGSESGGDAGAGNPAGGEPAQAGAATGGQGNPGGDGPQPQGDTYLVQQGKTLKVAANSGVLANDVPDGLTVTSFDDSDAARPADFNGVLDIAADGSLSFVPAAGFFGRYLAQYTVEDEQGVSATASVTIIVKPSAVDLAAVAQGIGGVALTGRAGEGIGAALAGLGDVNADGYDDFAVGAPGGSDENGSIYVVFGRPDFGALALGALADSSKETRYAALAGTATSPIGQDVSTAGKFDSDAIADIVVGSPGSSKGALFVVFGGADLKKTITLEGMAAERGMTITGLTDGQQLGLHVSGGGDYNGDAKTDLVSGLIPTGSTKGAVHTLLDIPIGDGVLPAAPHPLVVDSSLNGLPLALAFAGDVDGDLKDDVLASSRRHVALIFGQATVGEPANVSTLGTEGYGLVRQRPAGLTTTPTVAAAGYVNADKRADFVYCDEFAKLPRCLVFLRNVAGEPAALDTADWELAGFTGGPTPPKLASGADLNQDDFSDLLLADSSAAYVVFGRDVGFGEVDVTSLGSDGFALAASAPDTLAAIATIGDINGDGYGDFAVGEPTGASNSGLVYVVFGGPFEASQL